MRLRLILAMEQYSAHRPWHLYRIYSNPTHEKHQWLLLRFIVLLMMDAKGVPNTYSILVVVNKHNTARVASYWFIIYYRLVTHGNWNIKLTAPILLGVAGKIITSWTVHDTLRINSQTGKNCFSKCNTVHKNMSVFWCTNYLLGIIRVLSNI